MYFNTSKRLFLWLSLGMTMTGTSVVVAETDKQGNIEWGRYLVKIAGCNDCHTPGYTMRDGNVPVSQWLLGDKLGWRGGWGTTYAANLRLFVKDMSEDQWVHAAKTLKRRPPMPWFNLNAMAEVDLRAIYQFIKSLGDPGLPAPAYVPPDQQPAMPYAQFPSPPPSPPRM